MNVKMNMNVNVNEYDVACVRACVISFYCTVLYII